MAVYTDVSDAQLSAFVNRYDIGALLSVKGIAEGVENSNFLLQTECGFFILTLYEKRVNEADLPFFIGLMDHLAERGINCPRPVRDREGQTLQRLAGRPAAMVTFLSGMSVNRPNMIHCAELGRALAQLHAAGEGFSLKRANALSIQGWGPLFELSRNQADSVSSGLSARIERDLEWLANAWPKGLPEGIIHADLFPNNVFFLDERLSGLFDFYFACNDAFAYDLAICLNAWCFEQDGSFNITKAQAMVSAYEEIRCLTDAEVAALPVLARGACLRFLLTRLYDWLNVPPGALVKPLNPLEYDRKLGFHRYATSAAAYGLIR